MKMNTLADLKLKKEKEKEKLLELLLELKIIRINPDKKFFDIDDEIGDIQVFISNSNKKLTKESTKKSLIEDTEKLNKMVKQLRV